MRDEQNGRLCDLFYSHFTSNVISLFLFSRCSWAYVENENSGKIYAFKSEFMDRIWNFRCSIYCTRFAHVGRLKKSSIRNPSKMFSFSAHRLFGWFSIYFLWFPCTKSCWTEVRSLKSVVGSWFLALNFLITFISSHPYKYSKKWSHRPFVDFYLISLHICQAKTMFSRRI